MISPTSICNLALSHLGVSTEINDLENERSKEASACRRFYTQARDEVFRAFAWPFATKLESLALVEEQPNEEWAYAYRYPSDCVTLRRIRSGTRLDSRQTVAPYRVVRDDTGKLVLADLANANAEWTVIVEDANDYSPDFVAALALLLASYIAPRVAGGDQFKLGERAAAYYRFTIERARIAALSEAQGDDALGSEFERGRE